MQDLVDEQTEQKLLALLEQELEAMARDEPGQAVDRVTLVALNRRLQHRNINDILPHNVIFAGVQVYDDTKVRIMLRKIDA